VADEPARGIYREWLARTFSPAFKRTGLVNLVVGIALGFAAWKWPPFAALGTTLRWLIPVAAFASFFVYQAFRAPLEIVREVDRNLETMRRRAEQTEAQLQETRDCQAIADFLTKEHEYGVHKILHQPPENLQELPEWNRWVENWNTALFARMRELKCTSQEINRVETISIVEVMAGLPEIEPAVGGGGGYLQASVQRWNRNAAEGTRNLQIPIQMHAIRCDRVADVATKYANRAEEIKLAATKQILMR
jgi:hypothetical protein